ncbi:MAG TPA: NAD(P)-dependent alcohol dehydrogenase [Anaerolineales bacterium]|nr:NAD(P)-dependent alcohol dehydrogenase [Anaerolineales bacterium]
MKAMVWTKYGSPEVLLLKDVETPTPKDDEVLIKIMATTVLIGDCELRSLKFSPVFSLPLRLLLGFNRPKRVKILGQELAGVIEDAGKQVTRFTKGDPVIAATLLRLGTYAEYICLPESYPALKPASLTYEEAATIPTGGIYGLHLVRKADLHLGDKLLINGAGGSIGTYAIQIAKMLGAEVTAVDSAGKLEMLRSIGADHVIDYTHEDFTRQTTTYDAIIDVIGKSSFSRSLRRLRQNGRYVLGNPNLYARLRGGGYRGTTGKQVILGEPNNRPEAYTFLTELIETGKLKPIIDKCFPLEQLPEAHRYVETGQKRGNVVITVPHMS